ncbi:MAG: hypothetical protein HRT38_15440 [Alteromonadaceae bacterium]|nr:hypothetical protein [Alteromonadaceae bacterium]
MYEVTWFNEIFTTPSSKAGLITVLITAFITIFVVLLNQVLTHKRENKTFINSKIEELYNAASEFENAINNTSKEVIKNEMQQNHKQTPVVNYLNLK